jgi:hypothetical protein
VVELVSTVQAANALGCSWRRAPGIMGEPFAILREGCKDFPAWRIETLFAIRSGRPVESISGAAVELFSLGELSRLVGIGEHATRRRLPEPLAFRLYGAKNRYYWPRQMAICLRRAMKSGTVPLSQRGWQKPKDGVTLESPRHTLNSDQQLESQWHKLHSQKPWQLF